LEGGVSGGVVIYDVCLGGRGALLFERVDFGLEGCDEVLLSVDEVLLFLDGFDERNDEGGVGEGVELAVVGGLV